MTIILYYLICEHIFQIELHEQWWSLSNSHDPTLRRLLFGYDRETPSGRNYILCIFLCKSEKQSWWDNYRKELVTKWLTLKTVLVLSWMRRLKDWMYYWTGDSQNVPLHSFTYWSAFALEKNTSSSLIELNQQSDSITSTNSSWP